MDERLRLLSRAATLNAEPGARVRLLQEQVRRGEVDAHRVRLAAHLGDPIASAALGGSALEPATKAGDLVLSLKPFGPEVFARAAVVALRLLSPTPDDVVAVLEAWLACPCSTHTRAVRAAARRAALGEWDPAHVGPAAYVARLAATPSRSRGGCRVKFDDQGRTVEWFCSPRRRSRFTSSASCDEEVIQAIRRTLVAWALGPSSPSSPA